MSDRTKDGKFAVGNSLTCAKPGNHAAKPRYTKLKSTALKELQELGLEAWPREERLKAFKLIAKKAADGNLGCLKFLTQTFYGKPLQLTQTQHVGADGEDMRIIVEFTDAQKFDDAIDGQFKVTQD